ncbi:MAG: DUF5131 family protein [Myxococcales bacterium]
MGRYGRRASRLVNCHPRSRPARRKTAATPSRPGRRHCDCCLEWPRSIRDQCLDAGVPFFFKPWGGVRRKVAGRQLDRREWNQMPGFAAV